MKNKLVTDCSPQELRELADKLENEPKLLKTGTLKHDLFDFSNSYRGMSGVSFHLPNFNDWYFTEEFKNEIVENFSKSFTLIAAKGTLFNCYSDEDGEFWSDDEGIGIEDMDAVWADKHLTNIQEKLK